MLSHMIVFRAAMVPDRRNPPPASEAQALAPPPSAPVGDRTPARA